MQHALHHVHFASPLLTILIGPMLIALWLRMAKIGQEPSVIQKFSLGLFLLCLGFIVFIVASQAAVITGRASPLFVVAAYFIFPIAELCIMPISLSIITKLAPKDMNALLVGIWMLANAGAGYLTGVISKTGSITFKLTDTAAFKDAALIYRHLFSETSVVLAISGLVLVMLTPYLTTLIKRTD